MEKIIIFGDIDIQKQKFHQRKAPISMKNMDFNKTVVYLGKKAFKHFIGYKDGKKNKP